MHTRQRGSLDANRAFRPRQGPEAPSSAASEEMKSKARAAAAAAAVATTAAAAASQEDAAAARLLALRKGGLQNHNHGASSVTIVTRWTDTNILPDRPMHQKPRPNSAAKDGSGAAAIAGEKPLPPRVLQQTYEHLATKTPGKLPPKEIKPVRKTEGSAWAPATPAKPKAAASLEAGG